MKKSTTKTQPVSKARREIAKKATYAIPAVLTLAVSPSFASAASGTDRPETQIRPRR
jgi:hypothetical protein